MTPVIPALVALFALAALIMLLVAVATGSRPVNLAVLPQSGEVSRGPSRAWGLLLFSLALGALSLWGGVAHCAEPPPTPSPSLRLSAMTWSMHRFGIGPDQALFIGARVSADLAVAGGFHAIARVDASRQGDAADVNDVDVSDPATYQSLELYTGIYRPVARGLAAIAVAGLTLPIEAGRPDLVNPHPKTFGAGLSAVLDAEHKTWAVVLLGRHDAAGAGLKLLLTGQAHVLGETYMVGDAALGGGGAFARGGIALRLK